MMSVLCRSILKTFCCFLTSSAVCLLLFSCTGVKEIDTPGDIHKIENVPFFPQEDYQCGPASLAIVLNFWGIDVSPDDIAREIFSRTARGTLNIDMVLYANKMGLDTAQYRGNKEDLKKNIDSGFPVIVLVDYGFSLYEANHFMVIVGYNDQGVLVDSGRKKNSFILWSGFLKAWGRGGFWTLLIKKS
jgi:ABC-type bacteriocin/lantibiotic exporter with double-glycine peptidase domain